MHTALRSQLRSRRTGPKRAVASAPLAATPCPLHADVGLCRRWGEGGGRAMGCQLWHLWELERNVSGVPHFLSPRGRGIRTPRVRSHRLECLQVGGRHSHEDVPGEPANPPTALPSFSVGKGVQTHRVPRKQKISAEQHLRPPRSLVCHVGRDRARKAGSSKYWRS